ncbi:cell division protein FtsL [Pseudocolwellia sp. AS88]|jgi:cell division protein FtsL|uniref:cell division protein FtsL n=1 Tax=Pseudocolwellia sp. AS88 TaxID=3063958 RepID=UPI0026F329B6|nr:cell division protein FtsL [Pseudocolwellia sp. AS88]MDO7084991.1 cell division protein FtsL [Pseudocolwellia sp. AS88]
MASKKIVLAFEIWKDLKRNILVLVLLMSVLVSAFYVIYFTHMHRQTTSAFENLLVERDELDIEYRNLLLEQNSLAEHSAIESKAAKQLNMKRPDAKSEVIITLP